jgi:glutamate N-acetyltransferase / amino-acid N-acetyltransferase
MQMTDLPKGFTAHVANVGIKDDTPDFAVVVADRPCTSAAVFTRSRFAGPCVELSRWHASDGCLRAVVVVSKNANVATGPKGRRDAEAMATAVSEAWDLGGEEVLVAATGVIGRPLPMDVLEPHLAKLGPDVTGASLDDVATAMMTTDTHPKVASRRVGKAKLVGVAKGVGMIEPDMATLLAFLFTDAEIDAATLETTFRSAVDTTFNCVSIDTDTSTSDTASIIASGAAGPVDEKAFAKAVHAVCLDLTKQIAADGEGATKVIEVVVDGAQDDAQAKRVAKAVVNSPLVKTAVHGADPNWGRVAMAVGKCSDDHEIDQQRVTIRFGDLETYPRVVDDADLEKLATIMAGDTVRIGVSLGVGKATATVWGCDLSREYVHINADYTT